jgi:hypothetical protein
VRTTLCDLLGIEHPIVGFTPSEHRARGSGSGQDVAAGFIKCRRYGVPGQCLPAGHRDLGCAAGDKLDGDARDPADPGQLGGDRLDAVLAGQPRHAVGGRHW